MAEFELLQSWLRLQWQSHFQVAWLCLLCQVLFAQQPSSDSPTQNNYGDQISNPVDYLREVAPILDQHCIGCHGASKQTADLRLDRRSAILKGSGNGKIIEVGHSQSSRLIEVVSGADPDYLMPPEGDRLTEVQVATLRKWIDQGAPGPDDSKELDRKLPWSFSPIANNAFDSPLLADQLRSQATNPIDLFLLQRLQASGLEFASPADRRTLIRRLYLTALGVPPSVAEVQGFLEDSSSEAYERLVDRVLADARFGERLARHWFDVIRFAESNGFETNQVRYNAWPFRDYVIQSFNQDKSYDQFVTEQIVGDALGVDVATGYLVAGTYDLVKSPDVNLTLMQRQDELADLINTTGTTFLGLTLGCARCHDHKFDPITQADYYSLQAVLAGVNFGERALPLELTPESNQRRMRVQAEIARLESLQRELLVKAKLTLDQSNPVDNKLRAAVNAKLNEEEFPPILASAVRFTILSSGGSQPCIDEWEVFNSTDQNIASAKLGGRATASSLLPGYAIHQVQHLNDGKPGNENSWISNEIDGGWAQITFAQPEIINRMRWGRDRNDKFRDRVPVGYSIEALEHGKWKVIASSRDRRSVEQDEQQRLVSQLHRADQAEFSGAEKSKAALNSELKKLVGDKLAWIGTFSQPGEVHRLYRGDPLLKREVALPGTIAALGGQSLDEKTPEQSRRKALAQFITATSNPLTARVIVNRIWHYTFGTGIVDTPSDFGGNGTPPTHPELLDWLASEFVQHGWSIKHLQRQILLTHAFRQSSKPNQAGIAQDAAARLLWRFPPRRLEAEAIRDSMLVASGNIDWQMGGPGFFLQRVEQDNVYRYFPKEEFSSAEFRRMVYLTRVRGEQDTVFGSLDCPNGNQVIPKRSRSNTPLQALNLFNSNFVQQQAEMLAERLKSETECSASNDSESNRIERQIELAFELLVSRKPDRFELNASSELISEQGIVAFCRAMLNATEFLFVF